MRVDRNGGRQSRAASRAEPSRRLQGESHSAEEEKRGQADKAWGGGSHTYTQVDDPAHHKLFHEGREQDPIDIRKRKAVKKSQPQRTVPSGGGH